MEEPSGSEQPEPGVPSPPDQGRRGSMARLREEQILSDRVALLEEAPLFSVLNPDDLRSLASKFLAVRFDRGEVVFREGEASTRLFLIGRGRVKLSITSPAGQELLIGVLGMGQIFGELEVIDRGARAMDARAMEETVVYALAADVFWSVMETRPALVRRLLELMARRLRRADQTSQDLVFFDATTRLAMRLLQLAEDHGEPARGSAVRITLRVTQEEMAQMIGVTRESANRLIASFSGRGWIDWNDGYPIILEPAMLRRRSR